MRTMPVNGLKAKRSSNLPDKVLCADSGQVWSALAEIGRQLQILAGAHKGEGDFSAHVSPAPAQADTLSLTELTNEFLRAKARAGRSDRYLRALRYSLVKFSLGRGARPVTEITVHEVEDWLHKLKLHPRTLKGYLGDVRTLFNFGVRRNYLPRNPAAGVELPECDPAPPSLHTPDTVKTVLEFARAYDLNICRAFAVRYFAGLRTAEVERIGEEAMKPDHVEVSAANSKGARARRRRLVTIQPALRAWLALGGVLPAPPANGRRMLEFMRAMATRGVTWPHNVTRHSFASYHLAAFQNAGKTALEAGHTEQILFANYREIVTPEQAKEFWSITPCRLSARSIKVAVIES